MTQRTTVFKEGVSQVITVTIPEGERETQAFNIGSAADLAVIVAGLNTASDLEIQVAATEDGPFYSAGGGITLQPEAAGVLSRSTSDQAVIRPFSWLKIRTRGNQEPGSTALETGAEALADAVALDLAPGSATSGFIVAGDTFTIAGHPAPYTVTNASPLAVMGDGPVLSFTPGLDATVAVSVALAFSYVGDRGEAAARTIQVVTKD